MQICSLKLKRRSISKCENGAVIDTALINAVNDGTLYGLCH